MTDHQHFRELAATRLDFALDPRDATALEAHLAACLACRRFATYLQADADGLGRLPQSDTPSRVRAGVLAGRPSRRSGRGSPLLLVAAVGLVGLAAVGALMTGTRLLTDGPEPTADMPGPSSLANASPTPAVATASPAPTPRPAAGPPLQWARVPDQAAFHAPHGIMESVTVGGPGYVAVGDGCAKGDKRCQAAVWTSIDATTWTRVPDGPVFDVGPYVATRRGEMTDVIPGGPGLIAVGREHLTGSRLAVVWTSADGLTWTRVPDSPAFDRGTMEAVSAGGPGYVAVGNDVTGTQGQAAVWTSLDGVSWLRAPADPVFDVGGPGRFNDGRLHGAMVDIVTGGPGLVAVGSACASGGGRCRAAVWTSPDAVTWTRVPDGPVFAGSMYGVARWAGGLVAIGDDGTGKRPRAWVSTDGTDWTVSAPIEGLDGAFTSVEAVGGRLVAAAVSPDLHSAVFESTDGIHWTLSVSTAYLGNGAINGLGASDRGLIGVGWDGMTPAAAVWLGQAQP